MHLAMDIGVQAAKIRHARGRAHAAEETIALDQQRAPSRPRRGDRGRNARRPAAEDGDFIFAVERNLARGFEDGFGGQGGLREGRGIMPGAKDFGYRAEGLPV